MDHGLISINTLHLPNLSTGLLINILAGPRKNQFIKELMMIIFFDVIHNDIS